MKNINRSIIQKNINQAMAMVNAGDLMSAFLHLKSFVNEYNGRAPQVIMTYIDYLSNFDVPDLLYDNVADLYRIYFEVEGTLVVDSLSNVMADSLARLDLPSQLARFSVTTNTQDYLPELLDSMPAHRNTVLMAMEKEVQDNLYEIEKYVNWLKNKKYHNIISTKLEIDHYHAYYYEIIHIICLAHISLGNVQKAIELTLGLKYLPSLTFRELVTLCYAYVELGETTKASFYEQKLLLLARDGQISSKHYHIVYKYLTENGDDKLIYEFTKNILSHNPFDSETLKIHAISAYNLAKYDEAKVNFDRYVIIYNHALLPYINYISSVAKGIISIDYNAYNIVPQVVDELAKNYIQLKALKNKNDARKFLASKENLDYTIINILSLNTLLTHELTELINISPRIEVIVRKSLVDQSVSIHNRINMLNAMVASNASRRVVCIFNYYISIGNIVKLSDINKYGDNLLKIYQNSLEYLSLNPYGIDIDFEMLNFGIKILRDTINTNNINELYDLDTCTAVVLGVYFFLVFNELPSQYLPTIKNITNYNLTHFNEVAVVFDLKQHKKSLYYKDTPITINVNKTIDNN